MKYTRELEIGDDLIIHVRINDGSLDVVKVEQYSDSFHGWVDVAAAQDKKYNDFIFKLAIEKVGEIEAQNEAV